VNEAKEKCAEMLRECIQQVDTRLPANAKVFKGLSFLHPKKLLSHLGRASFSELPLPHLFKDKKAEIENQYRSILFVDWKESEHFKESGIPNDTAQFWFEVRKYQNAAGVSAFSELADYALACLCIPISNAMVERIFSTVTLTKTEVRNRLELKMLRSLLRIKTHLHFKKMCCKDFSVSPKMLSLYNRMWEEKEETEAEETEDVIYSVNQSFMM